MIEPHPPDAPEYWQTTRELVVPGAEYIRVPKGTRTDGASIPRVLWPVLGAPWSVRYALAAVVHDYIYQVQGNVTDGATYGVTMTRRQADYLFRHLLLDAGLGRVRAWVMWLGVRLGGWVGWTKDR